MPVDYCKILRGRPVAYFGEKHWQSSVYQEAVRLVPALRDAGFTHVAFESLDVGSPMFSSEEPEYPIAMRASELGMGVVGIRKEVHLYANRQAKEKFEARFDWCSLVRKWESSPYIEDKVFMLTAFRNCEAVMEVAPLLERGARIAFYGGMNHYGYWAGDLIHETTLNFFLGRERGVFGPVVYFASDAPFDLIDDKPNGKGPPIVDEVLDAARATALAQESFMIDTREVDDRFHPDWIVHVAG
jgi:hypothetical protein